MPAFLGAAADHRRAHRALPHPPPGRRRGSGRGCAAGRRRRPTRSAASRSRACRPRARWRPTWRCRQPGFGKFLARRDALAIILTVLLWLTASALRPDYWWNLSEHLRDPAQLHRAGADHRRAHLRHRRRRHRPLRRRGAGACRQHRRLFPQGPRRRPADRRGDGPARGHVAGLVNAVVTVGFKLPAFIATLGMFYIARGLAAWFVAGQQLTGWPESYNLLGRKVERHPRCISAFRCRTDLLRAIAEVVSVQTVWMLLVALRRRHRARLHAVRAEGLRHRRQHPRRRLCRHQHQPGALPRAAALGALRDHGRASSTSPTSAASTRSPASSASSTPSPR